MKLNLMRYILNGEKKDFTFQHKASEYIVKNFSSTDVYVSFDEDATINESIKILPDKGQICTCGADVDTIYVIGTGEIEVQQL